jgi:DNA repair exonuclease SbcCD ATPase subunit
MNERPTPETDTNVGEWDEGKFWDHPKGRIVEADFARKLERERDEALETVKQYSRQIEKVKDEARESKDRISQRAEAIRCELVESEKKIEAMRTAIRDADAALRSISAHDGPGFPHGTCCNIAGQALATLQPFITS